MENKSATELLLYRTYQETWKRGEKYADEGKVKISYYDNKKIEAVVFGSQKYQTELEFRGGGLSRKCTCPVSDFCKHLVALAILWDKARGIERPNKEDVESETIPPPLVSSADINKMYRDPLNADLDVLRIASSERGSWSRPHARLPNMPKIETDKNKPLSLNEIKNAFSQIEKWSNHRNYDMYFCAGEVVAGFCEVTRIIKKRLNASPLIVCAQILQESQNFHYALIMELIDDSDGLHEFTEAHLEDIYNLLKKSNIAQKDKEKFNRILNKFEKNRDNY
jgi:hypothetical protein